MSTAMQFQVPQFIDLAPKIVGPLTLKQFLYIAAAAVPSFVLFFTLQLWLWFALTFVMGFAALALAFYKINGQELPTIALAALRYLWQPRFFLWREERAAPVPAKLSLPKIPREAFKTPKLTVGSQPQRLALSDLALKLTTTTHPIAAREKPSKNLFSFFNFSKERFETFRRTTGDREAARRIDYR